jgi:hypothetical protein
LRDEILSAGRRRSIGAGGITMNADIWLSFPLAGL